MRRLPVVQPTIGYSGEAPGDEVFLQTLHAYRDATMPSGPTPSASDRMWETIASEIQATAAQSSLHASVILISDDASSILLIELCIPPRLL